MVKKEQIPKSSSRDLGFDDINSTAKRLKILNESLHKKAEDMRKKRNLIHLSSLEKSSDDYFSKDDVNKILSNAHDIIARVEEVLKEL